MPEPVLAIDIGGTKILAALVADGAVLDERQIVTERNLCADAWCEAVAGLAAGWRGRFDRVGAAVTGIVADGRWHALNAGILPVPADFPIVEALSTRLGCPVLAINDAQAAAWGEFRFGAGQGRDLVFLTVSTGIGGGIVLRGRLLVGGRGLAGHFGQSRDHADGERIEDLAGGRAIAAAARAAGHDLDAAGVSRAAEQGASWAGALLDDSARRLASLATNIQITLDPALIVLGGGVGLGRGYLDRVLRALADVDQRFRPDIRPAMLGARAGIAGVADLAAGGGRIQGGEDVCERFFSH